MFFKRDDLKKKIRNIHRKKPLFESLFKSIQNEWGEGGE